MGESQGQQMSAEELAELSVRCLMLKLRDGLNLLLPNTLVAEVTDLPQASQLGNMPEWLSGFVSWRGRNVPLIQFEQLLGHDVAGQHTEKRMVVLNTLNGSTQVPFIAMEIQALPHLTVLKHGMLDYDENELEAGAVVLASLRVDGESVIVPNIDSIERMLNNLGFSA